MKVRLLVDTRVVFKKGTVVEVEGDEAKRLVSLGFAVKEVEKVAPKMEVPEETPAQAETPEKRKKKRD